MSGDLISVDSDFVPPVDITPAFADDHVKNVDQLLTDFGMTEPSTEEPLTLPPLPPPHVPSTIEKGKWKKGEKFPVSGPDPKRAKKSWTTSIPQKSKKTPGLSAAGLDSKKLKDLIRKPSVLPDPAMEFGPLGDTASLDGQSVKFTAPPADDDKHSTISFGDAEGGQLSGNPEDVLNFILAGMELKHQMHLKKVAEDLDNARSVIRTAVESEVSTGLASMITANKLVTQKDYEALLRRELEKDKEIKVLTEKVRKLSMTVENLEKRIASESAKDRAEYTSSVREMSDFLNDIKVKMYRSPGVDEKDPSNDESLLEDITKQADAVNAALLNVTSKKVGATIAPFPTHQVLKAGSSLPGRFEITRLGRRQGKSDFD